MIRRIRRNKKSSHVEYICKGYTNKEGCSSHKMPADDLEKLVTASINNMVRTLCEYSGLAANIDKIAVSKDEAIMQNEELASLRKEIDKVETYRMGLFEDVQEGLISSEMYERLKKQYDERINSINISIEERTEMIDKLYSKGLEAEAFIKRFRNNPRIEKLDRVLLATLIDRILVYDNGTVEIVYRYSDEIKTLNQIIGASRKEGDEHGQN